MSDSSSPLGTPQPTTSQTPPIAPISPPENSNPNITPPATPTPKSRSRLLGGFTFLLLVIGSAWAALWFLYFQYHQSTDDAYSNGNMVNINSVVSGSVIAFFCDDTELVTEGQLIVQLDPTEYQIAFEKEIAHLANIVLDVRQLYKQIEINIANRESKKAVLAKAKFDFENRLALHDKHPLSVSTEDYMHSRDDYLIAEAEFKLAEKQLQLAKEAAGNTPLIEHSLIEQQKNNVRLAYYKLQHCSIYAPTTGYVAQRAVEVGQSVSPTTNLLAIIPTDYVWVDANFKETQLSYMRIGQPATVWFDLYGSKVMFEGKVLGIASGTGSIFSLIPPQNATGNWIKIVQRLPVRISLDAKKFKEYPIRLGISAEVDVDISNQNLPRLAQIPSTKPVASTSVFDLDLNPVNQMIEEVIQRNLSQEQNEGVDGK